jgi:hypothetical protein
MEKKMPNAAMVPFGRLDSLRVIVCSSIVSLVANRDGAGIAIAGLGRELAAARIVLPEIQK